MNHFKKVFIFAATLAVLLLPAFSAFADDADDMAERYKYRDYYVSAYDIQIEVTENNTLNVTENITAVFNEPSHGIFRYIPTSNYVVREDGSSGRKVAKVRNVEINEPYDTYWENGNCIFQIGNPDVTVIGSKNYKISYSYVLGRDIGDGFDELYYNIIGTGWDTYLENVTFSITMPKEFDESKLGFSAGDYGVAGVSDIEYSVNGNEISGRLTAALGPSQAFTVRLELPENYFKFNFAALYVKLAFQILIPAAALIAVIIIWSKYGKDKKVVKVVEFYPPEGMNSLDVAYWYKGYADNKDVIPLLIELANEGYINIREVKKKKIITKTDFMIEIVKNYNRSDQAKRTFFRGLLKCGNGKYTTAKDMEDSFYTYVSQILTRVNTYERRKEIFSFKSLILRVCGWVCSVVSAVASIAIAINIIDGYERFTAAFIGVIIAAAAFILSFFIRKRTDKGHELLQKITGFKMFLEKAEKARLEALVDENPSYYYDILPYAYVLGVSDAWTKNFEGIVMEPPRWYSGTDTFNRMVFWHFMHSTMSSATSAMTSSPQGSSGGGISGGGGFSGGGFSGGGVGGGGGGRW